MVTLDNKTKIVRLSDEDKIIKVALQGCDKKRRYSCFEWTQLIATICIPIIIAIYTIIQQRQDLQKTNMARASELEIAEANRLNELTIAEHNRQKDRDLAIDQQWENILLEYHRFLAQFLHEKNLPLTGSSRRIVLLMSHTTLNQLNSKRKRYVIRSLYEAKLITLNINSTPFDTSILEFGGIDLSNIMLGSVHDPSYLQGQSYYIDWYYLYLPRAILTNASFRHANLDCATLFDTVLDSADLSFAYSRNPNCFNNFSYFFPDFTKSSLVNASLYRANFYKTSFYYANLTLANMCGIHCTNCNLNNAIMVRVNLSGCFFLSYLGNPFETFQSAILTYAIAHEAMFISLNFDYSNWSYAQASEISLRNCTFINATMINVSFVKNYIEQVLFQQADLSYIDLSYAALNNVTFVNVNMRKANLSYITCNYCDFTNVDFRDSLLKGVSLRYSNFLNCLINDSQLEEAIDLTGSKLPNGTIVPN